MYTFPISIRIGCINKNNQTKQVKPGKYVYHCGNIPAPILYVYAPSSNSMLRCTCSNTPFLYNVFSGNNILKNKKNSSMLYVCNNLMRTAYTRDRDFKKGRR